ncbi:hypothetical protein K466DRAFT_299144 [Polyporus arcularius HHB13444]|uniref:Secreted protein n=1 Tax=Polyporus arcularius HHB13444 TaxID=1314778 RepID=A0A5C3NZ34_9APHY|nr:hypothetical protein K466DRAFT_299144 [Polyporus arcularius HHB13444]
MGSARLQIWLGVVQIASGLEGCVVVSRHGPVSARGSSDVICRDADAFLVTLLYMWTSDCLRSGFTYSHACPRACGILSYSLRESGLSRLRSVCWGPRNDTGRSRRLLAALDARVCAVPYH